MFKNMDSLKLLHHFLPNFRGILVEMQEMPHHCQRSINFILPKSVAHMFDDRTLVALVYSSLNIFDIFSKRTHLSQYCVIKHRDIKREIIKHSQMTALTNCIQLCTEIQTFS